MAQLVKKGLIPGLGRSSGKGKGYPLQYSGLENSMDCIVHGVAKSWTQLSDFHLHRICSSMYIYKYIYLYIYINVVMKERFCELWHCF